MQRALADRAIRRCAERCDHRIHHVRIVGGEYAESIAHRVVEAAFGQIEFDMPGLLLGTGLIEPRARDEGSERWVVARAAALIGGFGGGLVRRFYHRGSSTDLSLERLKHPGGFLTAGYAEVGSLFRLTENRLGVVLAVVAALAAILLAHGGHQFAAHRPAFSELHAFGDRHGGVVPGSRPVVAIACRSNLDARHQPCRILRRQRGGFAIQQPGEEAAQPLPLLRRERRVLRHNAGQGRSQALVHSAASWSKAASTPMSWRRVKARKVSPCSRCAR